MLDFDNVQHVLQSRLHVYTYCSPYIIRYRHLPAELVERATNGDTVMPTVDLENGKQRLEDTTKTLSGEKTSRKGESPEIEGLFNGMSP